MLSLMRTFPRGLGELIYWLVPTGFGGDFWGPESKIPRGWVLAYGQVVRAADYPRLAKLYGSTHGGDGVSTIGIPDKRGRASVGKDDMGGTAANRVTSGGSGIAGNTLGASGGAETVSLTTANLAAHNHGISDPGHGHSLELGGNTQTNGDGLTGNSGFMGGDGAAGGVFPTATGAGTGISTSNNGSGTAHQNMMPAIVCNYIIKA